MNTFTIVIGVLCVLYLGLVAPVLLVRNNNVKRYRLRLLDEIYAAGEADLYAGLSDFEWRYDAFDRVSHDAMMFQVWRSFDSFYPDKSFTQPRQAVDA